MTNIAQQPGRGLARRALLRNGLLTGVGAAVASVALPGITGAAQAATVNVDAWNVTDAPMQAQNGWRWCTQCSGLLYSPNDSPTGSCPFNGYHTPGKTNYDTPYATYQDELTEENNEVQHGWRYCNWCAGLYWGSGLASSHCPGNMTSFAPYITGPHNGSNTSYTYMLPFNGSEGGWSDGTPPLQAGWLWCKNCQGLFWAASGKTSAGLCPALLTPGTHNGSSSYKSYYLFMG